MSGGEALPQRLVLNRKYYILHPFMIYNYRADGLLEGSVHLLLKAANFRMITVRQAVEVGCTHGIQFK
jgi:hypothetical protein